MGGTVYEDFGKGKSTAFELKSYQAANSKITNQFGGRKMIYKYEIACREAGLSDEKIKEIRKVFDDDKKKLKRENECMEKREITYYSIFDVDPEYDFMSYEIADPSVNIEQDMIKKWEVEQLMIFVGELPLHDQEFLIAYFEEAGANDSKVAKKLGVPRTTVQSRRKKLLEKLRIRFEDEKIEME